MADDTARVVATHPVAYGRLAEIRLEPATGLPCRVCHRTGLPLLSIDTSGGEYGPSEICRECVNEAFDGKR